VKCKKYECAGDQTSRGGGGAAMYVQHNIEARSRNCCCHGKTISIKYYECVYLIAAFSAMFYIVTCGLSDCTVFGHVIS